MSEKHYAGYSFICIFHRIERCLSLCTICIPKIYEHNISLYYCTGKPETDGLIAHRIKSQGLSYCHISFKIHTHTHTHTHQTPLTYVYLFIWLYIFLDRCHSTMNHHILKMIRRKKRNLLSRDFIPYLKWISVSYIKSMQYRYFHLVFY